jgi:hypothetical protein
MKAVVIDFSGWPLFEDEQVSELTKICADSVEYMVGYLFNGAMATIDLEGDELFLNIHDEGMDNDLGRVSIDDIFNSYTDSAKLQTPESLKRAVTLRDKLEDMQKEIDKAVKGAKNT